MMPQVLSLAAVLVLTASCNDAFAQIRIHNSTDRTLTVYVQRENATQYDRAPFVVARKSTRVLTYKTRTGAETPYPPGVYNLAGKVQGEVWSYTDWVDFRDDQVTYDFFSVDHGADDLRKYFGVRVRPWKHPEIPRDIPTHAVSAFEHCSEEEIAKTSSAIQRAINDSAPVYNRFEYEKCYFLYRDVAKSLLDENSLSECIRKALKEGVATAERKSTPAEKAWAMRDALDGLLDVFRRRKASWP